MRYTVASIEDGIVCLENENGENEFVTVDKMPSEIREGDILDFDGSEYSINTGATNERRSAVYEKYKGIFKKR